MRKLLVAAILLSLSVMPVSAQIIGVKVEGPPVDVTVAHHAHGLVGTMSTSWLTVVTTDNHVLQILVPPNFKMPKDIQAGKPVACAYKISQNENILVRIKAEDGQKSNTNNGYVNSVPHF